MLTIFNLILIRILKIYKGNLFNQKKKQIIIKEKNENQLCFVHNALLLLLLLENEWK